VSAETDLAAGLARVEAKVDVAITQHAAKLEEHSARLHEHSKTLNELEARVRSCEREQSVIEGTLKRRPPAWPAVASAVAAIVAVAITFFAIVYAK
jgi:septal ring factor EnvC (AmiA/AmiB activator)